MKEVVVLQFRKPFRPLGLSVNYFIFAAYTACCSSSVGGFSRPYTDSWAVEISGGRHVADAIAEEHGFLNAGTVGNLKDMYHFILDDNNVMGAPPQRRRDGRGIHSAGFQEDRMRTIALQREDKVRYVQQQQLLQMVKKSYFPPQDPQWAMQWSLHNVGQTSGPEGLDLNVEPAWVQGVTGRGVVVTVVDDGIEANHPDLKINFDTQASHDFIERDGDPSPSGADYHGTACAGIIGMARNGVCGVGVAPGTNLGGLRLNVSNMLDITQADVLSYQNNYVDVYSNSWGPSETGFTVGGPGYVTQATLKMATQQGRNKKGTIYVWAAGNGGGYHDSCAADGFVNSIYTIAVGSADQNGQQAYYDEDCSAKMAVTFSYNSNTSASASNQHRQSNQLHTTSLNGQCSDSFTGTSAAAPLLSGVVALTIEANPDLTWRDVQYLIVYTSNPDILTGDDWVTNGAGLRVSHHFGFGAIDAEAMVTRARHWINVPDQISQSFTPKSIHDVPALDSVVMDFIVDNSKWNYDTITFLEHVVLTISLEVKGYEEEYTVDDFISYYNSIGSDREQLISWLRDEHPRRGDVKIELTSPQGTTSTLLPHRDFDFVNSEGYNNWPFMTVHNWGENPHGTWSLRVSYNSSAGYLHLDRVNLTLHGTSVTPEAIRAVPSQCDPACRRKCWGEGPAKCDACKQLRLDTTLECVEECPPGFTQYRSYCICEDCNPLSENTAVDTTDPTESGDGGGSRQLWWYLSISLSSVVLLLILVFVVVASYYGFQLVLQNYRKKKQTSFVRLRDNNNIYTATSV